MYTAVVGGTGALGGNVVAALAAQGAEVVVVSRNPPAPGTTARSRSSAATARGSATTARRWNRSVSSATDLCHGPSCATQFDGLLCAPDAAVPGPAFAAWLARDADAPGEAPAAQRLAQDSADVRESVQR